MSGIGDIRLAYAMTIHKSQGSEYPVVFIPLSTSHSHMLNRNLLYTAITRAKSAVVLVGSTKALQIAVKNTFSRERTTGLKHYIKLMEKNEKLKSSGHCD